MSVMASTGFTYQQARDLKPSHINYVDSYAPFHGGREWTARCVLCRHGVREQHRVVHHRWRKSDRAQVRRWQRLVRKHGPRAIAMF